MIYKNSCIASNFCRRKNMINCNKDKSSFNFQTLTAVITKTIYGFAKSQYYISVMNIHKLISGIICFLGYYIIEGDIMATSSIFTSVIINTEKEAKELITALENAEKAPRVLIDDPDIEYISDHDEIRKMFLKKAK